MSELAAPQRRNRLLLSQWAELLDDDSFRRYWLMRLASHGANNALTYALLVFTIKHSSSAIATGLLLLTLIVPSALLGAVAGVAVDRRRRRRCGRPPAARPDPLRCEPAASAAGVRADRS
jgi:hypothetical protein